MENEMSKHISHQAEISPKAKIGKNCKIYPFAYIEEDVVIGDNCVVYPFVSIMNGTRMGNNNKVFQNTVLAALPQDFEFRGEESELVIGDNNIIRENVVVNRATHAGGRTIIGNNNFLMEGVHISHDVVVGNNCVLGYGAKIAGDCVLSDGVIFSSSIIANPRTRIGEKVMVVAGTTFSKDVPPYIVVKNNPVGYDGVNTVMLDKYGIDEKTQKHIANAYRLLFNGQNSSLDAANQIEEQVPDSVEIRNIVSFIRSSKLGIITKM